jgi:hypothetical protein
MLKFIANLFGAKKHEAPTAETPYKVEAPTLPEEAKAPKAPKAKKTTVKKATTRKPKA